MKALKIPTDIAGEVEALFREARRRRRRRRVIVGIAVAASAVALIGILLAVGGIGRGGQGRSPAPSLRPSSASAALPAQTVPAGAGVVGRGPTVIDFSDPSHGWIASGGDLEPPTYNPTIVRTTNGGLSWQRTPVPNFAAQNLNPATNYVFGGLVGVHFADAQRGWFLQGGLGWQTNDAGTRWTKMHLPLVGSLVALTSAGADVWALIDTCPIDAVSCPQSMGKGTLFHAISAPVLTWQRVGGALPAGYATLSPAARRSVIVAFGNLEYHRSLEKVSVGSRTGSCASIGPLSGASLAGVCDGGGGGNASVSNIAVSDDGGTTWHTLVAGPPSTAWMGSPSTNGADAVFYVTGGQTLWRTSTSAPGWQAVLEAPAGSTEEIFPVYVFGQNGYALMSSGLDAHWFETNDGGVSWQPVTLP